MGRSPVQRVVRSLARAPIPVFTAGYGVVFGHRVLMVEHVGRRTGRPRHVVLEVIRHLPDGRVLVPAGLGRTADWFRNVEKNPRVRFWLSRQRGVPATARVLGEAEALDRFAEYRTEHRWTWSLVRRLLTRMPGRAGQPDEALFRSIPLVELTPDG